MSQCVTTPPYLRWQLRTDPPASASHHMGVDADLLRSYELEEKPPILRVYSWQEKCATFGSKQNRTMVMEKLTENLPIACRPTGGGICVHDEGDLAVSFFLPNPRRDLLRIRQLQNVLCQWVKEECARSAQLQGINGEDSTLKQNSTSVWCAERCMEGELWDGGKKILAIGGVLKKSTFLLQANIRGFREVNLDSLEKSLYLL